MFQHYLKTIDHLGLILLICPFKPLIIITSQWRILFTYTYYWHKKKIPVWHDQNKETRKCPPSITRLDAICSVYITFFIDWFIERFYLYVCYWLIGLPRLHVWTEAFRVNAIYVYKNDLPFKRTLTRDDLHGLLIASSNEK